MIRFNVNIDSSLYSILTHPLQWITYRRRTLDSYHTEAHFPGFYYFNNRLY